MWNCTHEIDTYGYPLPLRGDIFKKNYFSFSHCVLLSALTYALSPTPHLFPESKSNITYNTIYNARHTHRYMQCNTDLHPRQITNINQLESSKNMTWVWEPLADCLYAAVHVRRVQRHIEILDQRVVESKNYLKDCTSEYELFVRAKMEKYPMQFEDSRSRFIRTDESLISATMRINSVMDYSKQNIETYALEEQNLQEDWKQDYDGLEDGSAWVGLNDKRKIEKVWKADLARYHQYYKLCPPLIPTQKKMQVRICLCLRLCLRLRLRLIPKIDV